MGELIHDLSDQGNIFAVYKHINGRHSNLKFRDHVPIAVSLV
jgi:hypothetical protein